MRVRSGLSIVIVVAGAVGIDARLILFFVTTLVLVTVTLIIRRSLYCEMLRGRA
jgi:hypothetical protein